MHPAAVVGRPADRQGRPRSPRVAARHRKAVPAGPRVPMAQAATTWSTPSSRRSEAGRPPGEPGGAQVAAPLGTHVRRLSAPACSCSAALQLLPAQGLAPQRTSAPPAAAIPGSVGRERSAAFHLPTAQTPLAGGAPCPSSPALQFRLCPAWVRGGVCHAHCHGGSARHRSAATGTGRRRRNTHRDRPCRIPLPERLPACRFAGIAELGPVAARVLL